VAPTFINLADASIKMVCNLGSLGRHRLQSQIETVPTRNQDAQPLQNVLSVSTAGKNRYLLHFNSLHSLTQWTAGIRLSMFEHASLQELYTGSLIAGKGKHLNNIRAIMEKSKFRTEDWARVRFGAGTPWRRCWCVIDPPDEKEFNRLQKSLKKKSSYDRPALPKGDIKFYDTRKTKKAMPIATITDAYSAYAIYPQSKPLIEQSTLVKVEGKITIHSNPESKTEGFVFVMPEVHPAVSGFEMMLRWLFPVYDNFRLYGRPERLIADAQATQGLMFAMPKERRYGYLDIIDVAALIHTPGSEKWTERDWRKQLKEATKKRMDIVSQGRTNGNLDNTGGPNANGESKMGVRYDDGASVRSQPSTRHQHMSTDAVFAAPNKSSTAPPEGPYPPPAHSHARSVSESMTLASSRETNQQNEGFMPLTSSTDRQNDAPAQPRRRDQYWTDRQKEFENVDGQNNLENESMRPSQTRAEEDMRETTPPAPVAVPPTFTHHPGDRPQTRPNAMPELRREKSRMSTATLSQLVDASRMGTSNGTAAAGAVAAWKTLDNNRSEDQGPRGVNHTPTDRGMPANQDLRKGMVAEVQHTESPIAMSAVDSTTAHLQTTQSRRSSAHSINRKPVPTQAPPVPTISADGNIFGPAPTLASPSTQRRSSDNASQYLQSVHDRDDDSEPDYASTRKSSDSRRSESKPRTGVLKSVGNPEMAADSPPVPPKDDIPAVDFGPTQSLTPTVSRPGTAMGRKSPHDRSLSGTPNDEKRLPYLRSASPAPVRPQAVAWQPGSGRQSPGRQSPGLSLTPEEFVQQRATAARIPNGYVPQRSRSEQVLPVERPRDSMMRQHSRQISPAIQPDYSSRLSALEQEHVARMTGTPLVMNVPDKRQSPDPSVGLVGAIEAREQEKRNLKEGLTGQMVQHAIAQRQAQNQAQLAAQHAYNYSSQQQQQQQQTRQVMSQEALSYNYPQQQRNVQRQQSSLVYNYPQQQQQQGWQPTDAWQNGQWANPQAQAYFEAQQRQQQEGQRQGQGGGQYYQQVGSGYHGPGQGQ
jgi:CCR4-NOT transcriptional complex subunit CAF120